VYVTCDFEVNVHLY